MKLFSLASLALLLFQTGVSPLQQPKATGSIEGTITRSGSNLPVARARVTVTRRAVPPPGTNATPGALGAAPPAPITPVTTDDNGRFSVPDLDDGAYNVQVVANGFVAQPYGRRFPNGPGAPVAVNGGQPTKDVNVALLPAANISGHVRDTSDHPLGNVSVQLLRYSYDFNGQRTYQSVGNTTTNDRGEYRMYWVTPGRYYLLAGQPSTGSNPLESLYLADTQGANGNEVPRVLGYAFYPGVTEIASALTLDLQAGADVQSIDVALAIKPRTFKLRGKLVDSRTGQAPPRASVFVASQTPGLNPNSDIFLGPDTPTPNYNAKTGIFEIRDLLPGNYSLVAMVVDPPVPGRPGPLSQLSGMIPVTIGSSDVDNAVLTVNPAVSIPGRIRVDGQLPAQMTMDRLRVRLIPVGTGSGTQQSLSGVLANVLYQNPQGSVAADGTFRLNNIVPGDYRVDFSGFSVNNNGSIVTQLNSNLSAANAYLKDVRFDGVDAITAPLHFSGSVNNGLEVVLGIGGGKVAGTVTDVRSRPVDGVQVVIVPDRSRFRTDLYRTLSTDQNGRFTSPSLPPGDYKVFSWESIEQYAWFDSAVLSRAESQGSSVHISDSSTQTISVQIIPTEATR